MSQEGNVSLWTSLPELKGWLQIDPEDHSEDQVLMFYAASAAAWIEKYLNRRGYIKRERTEYYDGSGTQTLQLLSVPVYLDPVPRVWIDERGLYGEHSAAFPADKELTYGEGFAAVRNSEGGLCTSGLLVRQNELWPKPGVRQRGYLSPFIGHPFGNVKVTYTGGHTADTLPQDIVLAAVTLVSRMRLMFPLGVPLSSESYEERSISQFMAQSDKHWLTGGVKHLLWGHRRWKF